nr:MAG TPA: hypothetical protein [Caudoviricetes sp.]
MLKKFNQISKTLVHICLRTSLRFNRILRSKKLKKI